MKNLISAFSRLAVVLTGALALGSCSRAEYAFLPKSASYLGTATAAPQARAAAPTPAPEAQVPAAAVAPEITVATAPVVSPAPAAATATAPRPAAAPTPPAPAEAVAASAPPKLRLLQRLAVSKVLRKLEKQTQRITARQGDNTASTTRSGLDSKLRYAIIFGAIGLILLLFPGSLIHTVATILFIIALLFLLFWLLDNL